MSSGEKDDLLVNGKGLSITRGETQLQKAMFSSFLQASDTEHCRALIQMMLFAMECSARKLDQDPKFRARLDQIIRNEVFNYYVSILLADYPLSEGAIESYYYSHREEFKLKNGGLMPLDSKSRDLVRKKIMGIKKAEIINDELARLMKKYPGENS